MDTKIFAEGVPTNQESTDSFFGWRDVPGYFDYANIYDKVVTKAPMSGAKFVEIGIMFGRSTLYMANAIARSSKNITYDAIDKFGWSLSDIKIHYEASCEFDKQNAIPVPPSSMMIGRQILEQERVLECVVQRFINTSKLSKFVNLIKTTAQEHATQYEDGSLDFVFVDAEHTYNDTKEILDLYIPKIRPGGIFAGHDYISEYPGIIRAVTESFGTQKVIIRNGTSFVVNF